MCATKQDKIIFQSIGMKNEAVSDITDPEANEIYQCSRVYSNIEVTIAKVPD